MLDEVLNSTRVFGIVCERENVAEDEVHLEHPFGVATAGLIRVSKKHDDGTSFVLLQGIKRGNRNFPKIYRIIETEEMESYLTSHLIISAKKLSKHSNKTNFLEEVTDEMSNSNSLDDDDDLLDLAAFTLCKHTLRKSYA